MELKRLSDEVLYATDPIVTANHEDVESLQLNSSGTTRRRIRLCAHTGTNDPLHEMLIVLESGGFVRPHKHIGKSESYHVIEGQADLILFDETGRITRIIEMGDYQSGRIFFLRLNCTVYHTVHVLSPRFTFHEITNGPLKREQTQYAPWAPAEGDDGIKDYVSNLENAIMRFRQQPSK